MQPSVHEETTVPHQIKSRRMLHFVFLAVALVFFLIGFTTSNIFYASPSNDKQEKKASEKDRAPLRQVVPETNQTYSILESDEYLEFQELLNNVGQGNVDFVVNGDDAPYFEKQMTFSFDEQNFVLVTVSSYQYSPGATLEGGYEGFVWTHELDNEVAAYKNLQPGTRITQAPMTSLQSPKQYDVVTTEGNEEQVFFAHYDQYFQPSASFTRSYLIWLEQAQQMVRISVIPYFESFEPIQKYVCNQDGTQCGLFTIYSNEAQGIFLEIEKLLYFVSE